MSRLLLLLFSLLIFSPQCITAIYGVGRWELLQKSIGIAAIHMQLLNDDKVIIYDRNDLGPSNFTLTYQQCRKTPNDCTAHSVEYHTLSNTFRPVIVLTNTWCSSGATIPNGTLVQTGGDGSGDHVVRTFQPFCIDCDWVEHPNSLLTRRWYSTDHVLPDGRVIIIGGQRAFNYEFFPKTPSSSQLYELSFLQESSDRGSQSNLYPIVFLQPDGNLFIFGNNRAILFDYNVNVVVPTYPTIPGVALPLKNLELGLKVEVEVLICRGAPKGSYLKAKNSKEYLPALNTCARMKITDLNPTWEIETMPMIRVMGDMVVLPNGNVLIINGAGKGTAGWELGREPVLSPVKYHPDNAPGSRFEIQEATQIPRMYHSCAVLLRDGRVLVGGSNPHQFYNFTNVLFPTELSLEAFSPPYLDPVNTYIRPVINTPTSGFITTYLRFLTIQFSITQMINSASVKFTMLRPPFNTHAQSMSQRLLVLTQTKPVEPIGRGCFEVEVITPNSPNIAPPGFYMLFMVHQDIPSRGIWVQLIQ